ncbi:MAG: ArgE/DapE family deacylase [Candidatus Lokiarchaeota archaeon]|nr:ArgE/DapE family deacylase [Candidatus Lokiarchaeota archaeon]MBD3338261.1 ArgE/DapE family deacylase [Candidatus Lokiarchaeota archaeon]
MNNKKISKKNLTNIVTRLVKIPSENPPGRTEEIVNYLATQVFDENEGFQNQILSYSKDDILRHCLVSQIGNGKRKLVFSGHFDVVPPGDISSWKYHPFSGQIEDGKLYGRGAADMKAGITAIIGTIKNLKNESHLLEKYTLMFVGTTDEEVGMEGARILAEKGIMKDAELLIITEPTNLQIGIAQKGALWLVVQILGKAAHGSTPQKGTNAIEGTMKLIPNLYYCLSKKENNLLGTSSLNIGKIKGGTAINIVPEEVFLKLDYRLIPEEDPNSIIEYVKNLDALPCKIKCEVLNQLPALLSKASHPFVQNLKKSSKSQLIGLNYATDAARLIDLQKKIPFVIFGPGNPEVIHKVNEYVELNQIFSAIEYLTNSLLKTYNN